ncbi:hypothetical protein DKG77_08980 [Flagellimonas aquimarina]|uniref:Uncharacterized protein n=1 Tax=Flagellimonas aquimarina TaxID=2201895 RepID=A0A316KZZ0_9FLAO|nr:hypothetical protein DKG77_08980 [Allomuricauda koreensis]
MQHCFNVLDIYSRCADKYKQHIEPKTETCMGSLRISSTSNQKSLVKNLIVLIEQGRQVPNKRSCNRFYILEQVDVGIGKAN